MRALIRDCLLTAAITLLVVYQIGHQVALVSVHVCQPLTLLSLYLVIIVTG